MAERQPGSSDLATSGSEGARMPFDNFRPTETIVAPFTSLH
jgi:hypothetical protein